MNDSQATNHKLRDVCCPACRSSLVAADGAYACGNPDCNAKYPAVDGRPVLINESNSVFRIRDFQARKVTTMDLRDHVARDHSIRDRFKTLLDRITPDASMSISDFDAGAAIAQIIAASDQPPRILVIGAGDAEIHLGGDCEIVYSDVALGALTDLICDAHDIPFPDGSFDAVLAIAMLEHVVDPFRVVDQIYRVLRNEGYVYAVTPFMQQVHMGRYDFMRFSHLGHRRLFRWFTEVRSGIANGAGMVLAWSIERYLAGVSDIATVRSVLRTLARFIAFPFCLTDKWWGRRQSAYDNASAYYFFGRKSEQPISDREIIAGYRGTMS